MAESLWPKEIGGISARLAAERKVEHILEMSFDHTAAMISLLNAEADELVAISSSHSIYHSGRLVLRANIQKLVMSLEKLKEGKGDKLDKFQRKCQEFGI